jgi:molecular chaperone GrpE
VTEQNRRDETAQPAGAAQSGQHQTDPAGEPVRRSGSPNDTGATRASGGEQPEQPFAVRDKRRKPSPRPRPTAGPDDGPPPQSQQSDSGDTDGKRSGAPAGSGASTSEGTESADGATRTASGAAEDKAGGFAAELQALRSDLDERTKDLQRITAEYANYRRRIERDRRLVAEQATASVLNELLGVLDDLDRARAHGDLVGPFGAVAEQLSSVFAKLGLTPFGEKGDAFDPTRHEAVAHLVSAEVTESTCVEVFRRGYQYGERLLRPALVAVADPAEEDAAGSPEATEAAPAPAAQESADQPGDAASDASADKPGEPGGSATTADPDGTAAAGSPSDGSDASSPGGQSAAADQSGGHDAGSNSAAGSHNEKSAEDG